MNMYKRVVCADGFSVSVQAGRSWYGWDRCCYPNNNIGPWESVECGFPTEKDSRLEAYADEPNAKFSTDGRVDTFYAWVPSQVIMAVIESHGGMVSGELPKLIDDPDYEGASDDQ